MRYIGAAVIASVVTVLDFKRAIHLTPDDADDDVLIAAYLLAAQELVETAIACPLAPRPYEFTAPACAWSAWWFPVRPVVSLDEMAVRDEAGIWAELDTAEAFVVQMYDEPRLVVPDAIIAELRCATEVRVRATAGIDARVQRAEQAIILTVKEWLDAGISIDGAEPPKMTFGAHNLIRQVRYRRPYEIMGA
ncbi:hypothetical protein [Roseobacter sp. CCS2]|uniref:hypothetical protein n=1 Tax=Roseobacter sp. CCS2 TaxID=391593 RepID=UPI0000F3C728|nr:hypothetical protein [Roseobacter sp. CCS2]EBA11789.1 hypothetical protein RCCS2_17711 [Roseobacter sp. CCS2]